MGPSGGLRPLRSTVCRVRCQSRRRGRLPVCALVPTVLVSMALIGEPALGAAHRGVHPNDVALKKWREVPLIAKVVLVPDMHNDRVNVYPYKMRKLPPGSLPPR